MNTVMTDLLPSPEEMGGGIQSLAQFIAQALRVNAKTNPELEQLVEQYGAWVSEYRDEFEIAAGDMLVADDRAEAFAARIVLDEINVVLERHSSATEGGGEGGLANVADDVETVKGSIEAIFEKLPKWLRNVLDVGLELLRLAGGRAD